MQYSALQESPNFLYFPVFHRSLAPAILPPGVAFMHPGLPGIVADGPLFLPPDYPFSPAEAAAALREMLRLGESLNLAATWSTDAPPPAERLEAELSEVRRRLIAPEGSQGTSSAPEPLERGRIAAQKALLLAWDLEERLTEIHALHAEIAQSGLNLARLIAGDGEPPADGPLAELASLHNALQQTAAPPWPLALTAIAPFIPPETRLFTCEAAIGEALEERHLPLEPLRDAAIPDGLFPPLFRVRAPLWQIIGASAPHAEKPWLLSERTLFIHPVKEL